MQIIGWNHWENHGVEDRRSRFVLISIEMKVHRFVKTYSKISPSMGCNLWRTSRKEIETWKDADGWFGVTWWIHMYRKATIQMICMITTGTTKAKWRPLKVRNKIDIDFSAVSPKLNWSITYKYMTKMGISFCNRNQAWGLMSNAGAFGRCSLWHVVCLKKFFTLVHALRLVYHDFQTTMVIFSSAERLPKDFGYHDRHQANVLETSWTVPTWCADKFKPFLHDRCQSGCTTDVLTTCFLVLDTGRSHGN